MVDEEGLQPEPLLEMRFPKHKQFIPSATGLGLAFTINGFNSISMFIGAGLALWFSKARPKLHEQYTIPVSSGLIAGESLMGVVLALIFWLLNRQVVRVEKQPDAQLKTTGQVLLDIVTLGRYSRRRLKAPE